MYVVALMRCFAKVCHVLCLRARGYERPYIGSVAIRYERALFSPCCFMFRMFSCMHLFGFLVVHVFLNCWMSATPSFGSNAVVWVFASLSCCCV